MANQDRLLQFDNDAANLRITVEDRLLQFDNDAANLRITVEALLPSRPWVLLRFDAVMAWLRAQLIEDDG